MWHALYVNLVQLGASNLVVTYAEKSRYREYEQRLTEFLNGLTVSR